MSVLWALAKKCMANTTIILEYSEKMMGWTKQTTGSEIEERHTRYWSSTCPVLFAYYSVYPSLSLFVLVVVVLVTAFRNSC
jgi:hypothetical protein